ncbi:MAG TPA: hypothetical protein V6D17_13540 [Candidatus Obscuribacterales bacterium]
MSSPTEKSSLDSLRSAKGSRRGRTRGSSLAELGPALFLGFILLFFPLFTLGTLGLRYTFLILTARESARAAARCRQFEANVSPTELSSINKGKAIAYQYAASFKGVGISDCRIYIQICDVNTKAKSMAYAKLTSLDTANNVYNVGAQITGSVEPVLRNANQWWGNIPGLTAPFTVITTAAQTAENPEGLTK